MNSTAALTFLLIFAFLFQDKSNTTVKKVHFPHSSISLMPEGEPENLRAFLPIKPKIVAWGADPIHVNFDDKRMKEKLSGYKNLGAEFLASNVWMLTATERYLFQNPRYQTAVCVDIEGKPIVPGWLDSEYNGVKPWWGCTNNPLYRELLIKRALGGIRNGANMLHLDDHMGTAAAASHAGGCFCDYCMKGFNAWLKENFSTKELSEMGIKNIADFNYSEMIKNLGYITKEKYLQAVTENKIPLREEFMKYQLYEAAEFVKELGLVAAKEAGTFIPVGVNSWNLAPTQLATSHYADYFSNEVSHFDVEDLNPPFVYLLGNALGKPVFSTGTGEDWIYINQKGAPVRVQRWIATAYAFGQYFMYSYNKWGFSEKTGTQWYQIPIEIYEPLCSFINQNPQLFDGYEPYEQVGILYENEVCRKNDREIKSIVKKLNETNVPIGLVASGDTWLKRDLTLESLNRFKYLILSEKTNLSENEKVLIDKFAENHPVFSWIGEEEVLQKIPNLLKVTNAEKVWALPRIKEEDGEITGLVVHLLNQDYDAEKDKMNRKTDFMVFLSNDLLSGLSEKDVRFYSPENEPVLLKSIKSDKGIYVSIPFLDLWGLLVLETK